MFRLSAHDNGLYFIRGRLDVKRCPLCGALVDKWGEDFTSVPIPKIPKYDVSYSYDGILVTTRRFKEAIDRAGILGMAFWPVQQGLFVARPEVAVLFDFVRRGTRFGNRCEICGQYEFVAGATPVFLAQETISEAKVFYRTDLEFGSSDEKTPLVLCGNEAATELRKAKLRGLELVSVKLG